MNNPSLRSSALAVNLVYIALRVVHGTCASCLIGYWGLSTFTAVSWFSTSENLCLYLHIVMEINNRKAFMWNGFVISLGLLKHSVVIAFIANKYYFLETVLWQFLIILCHSIFIVKLPWWPKSFVITCLLLCEKKNDDDSFHFMWQSFSAKNERVVADSKGHLFQAIINFI